MQISSSNDCRRSNTGVGGTEFEKLLFTSSLDKSRMLDLRSTPAQRALLKNVASLE